MTYKVTWGERCNYNLLLQVRLVLEKGMVHMPKEYFLITGSRAYLD
jgi:hypothetical protein